MAIFILKRLSKYFKVQLINSFYKDDLKSIMLQLESPDLVYRMSRMV